MIHNRVLIVAIASVLTLGGRGDSSPSGEFASGREPAWSPDGTRIAFAYGFVPGDSDTEIIVARADGSSVERLTANEDQDHYPTWTPDGRSIVFARRVGGRWLLHLMNTDGTNQRSIGITLSLTEWGVTRPSVSPDGQWVAYAADTSGAPNAPTDIYVAHLDGSASRRLTTQGGSNPGWSPDGSHLVFTSRRTGTAQQFVIGANGTGERQLAVLPGHANDGVWSPDGRFIYYNAYAARSPISQIHRIGADGTGDIAITSDSARKHYPAVSPDGRTLAYASDRETRALAIYLQALGADAPARRLTQ